MFEKEAEEYADKSKPSFVVNEYGSTVYTLLDIEQAFQKGAEFGYNKAKEELKAQIEKMKSDVMANIKWADKNCDNMWQKLVKMWNQWEIKENE